MGSTIVILTLLVILFVFLAFVRKLSLQFAYLHLKEEKSSINVMRFISRDLSEKEKDIRNRSLLLFPLLFGVDKEDEGEELNSYKNRIRSLHLALYLLLMVVVLLGLIGKGPAE